ncbi:MAG TPA: hypothetical protein VE010_01330, partial [Thermoanaerobaculia bacterium]|nr:hypothetical protein [Thermoanaerobaculia bacterium]
SGAYNVNFRTKRTTAPTPAQISINCPLVANASQVFVSSPTADGFRFNITSAAAGDVYAVHCTYTVTN